MPDLTSAFRCLSSCSFVSSSVSCAHVSCPDVSSHELSISLPSVFRLTVHKWCYSHVNLASCCLTKLHNVCMCPIDSSGFPGTSLCCCGWEVVLTSGRALSPGACPVAAAWPALKVDETAASSSGGSASLAASGRKRLLPPLPGGTLPSGLSPRQTRAPGVTATQHRRGCVLPRSGSGARLGFVPVHSSLPAASSGCEERTLNSVISMVFLTIVFLLLVCRGCKPRHSSIHRAETVPVPAGPLWLRTSRPAILCRLRRSRVAGEAGREVWGRGS